MDVLSLHRGQVFLRLVNEETRGFYVPRLYDLARAKYGFVSASDMTKAATEGAKFQGGKLEFEGREIVFETLDFYNDGIIVACRSTSDADIILDDAIEWLVASFGMKRPKNFVPRVYTSWIIVEFPTSTSALFRNFAKLQKLIAETHEEAHGTRLDFEVAKLSIAVDPKTLPQFTNTEYLFDRRGGASFSDNYFFCAAPLRTEVHIKLLEKLERLLS